MAQQRRPAGIARLEAVELPSVVERDRERAHAGNRRALQRRAPGRRALRSPTGPAPPSRRSPSCQGARRSSRTAGWPPFASSRPNTRSRACQQEVWAMSRNDHSRVRDPVGEPGRGADAATVRLRATRAGASPERGERVLNRLRKRLSYANIVASVALFIGLGGVGYAATASKNSVQLELDRRTARSRTSTSATNAVTSAEDQERQRRERRSRRRTRSARKLTALRTDLDDAPPSAASRSPRRRRRGRRSIRARQAAGTKDIESSSTGPRHLGLPTAGKYLITGRRAVYCTYDGSDGVNGITNDPPGASRSSSPRRTAGRRRPGRHDQPELRGRGAILVVLARLGLGTRDGGVHPPDHDHRPDDGQAAGSRPRPRSCSSSRSDRRADHRYRAELDPPGITVHTP